MKFLDNVDLESHALKLSKASRRFTLEVVLESYSCKMVSEEKRSFKALRARLEAEELQENSLKLGPSLTLRGMEDLSGNRPSSDTYFMSDYQAELDSNPQARNRSRTTSVSSSGDNVESSWPTITAKELFCFQSTLEQAFGFTYDFSSTTSEDFSLEPELKMVKAYISRLCSVYADKYEHLAPSLWAVIEREIHASRCIIYSFKPNRVYGPYSNRHMAAFNYFFFNRSLKRILFFSMIVRDTPPEDAMYEKDMEDLY
ncbi:hypothetical protein Aperf_G00000071003 [Anoplocephala perfoliata]